MTRRLPADSPELVFCGLSADLCLLSSIEDVIETGMQLAKLLALLSEPHLTAGRKDGLGLLVLRVPMGVGLGQVEDEPPVCCPLVESPELPLGLRGAGGGLAKQLFPHRAGEAQGLEALLVELLERCVCFVNVGHRGSFGGLGVGGEVVPMDH